MEILIFQSILILYTLSKYFRVKKSFEFSRSHFKYEMIITLQTLLLFIQCNIISLNDISDFYRKYGELICILLLFVILNLISKCFFRFVPKGCKDIYNYVFADGGIHLNHGDNTIEAYLDTIAKMSIKISLRKTKDNKFVCFSDRYTMELLEVPGSISNKTLKEIKRLSIFGFDERVPSLKKVVNSVVSDRPILVDIKGYMTTKDMHAIIKILQQYNGIKYFETANIINYIRLHRIVKSNVLFKLNLFRKKLNVLFPKKYIKIPNVNDILFSIEENDTIDIIIKKMYKLFNEKKSRIDNSYWLVNEPIVHRGKIEEKNKENSIESIISCVNVLKNPEIDLVWYKNSVRVYHEDKVAKVFGQKATPDDKIPLEDSITFEEVLSVVNGNVKLVLDVKDYHMFSKKLIKNIMDLLKDYKGEFVIQSFNSFILMWLKKHYPYVIRGQVGHSLSGLKRTRNLLLYLENFFFLNIGDPDFYTYNMDPYAFVVAKRNKTIGKRFLIYDVKSFRQVIPYIGLADNVISSDYEDESKWGKPFYHWLKHKKTY